MKTLLTSILLFLFVAACGQQAIPDSGFTNKTEAKNEMKDSLKEGKWIEYLDEQENIIKKGAISASYYCLLIYKAGAPYGVKRIYYPDGMLWHEISYLNGKKDGVEKYYSHGNVSKEMPYKDGKLNGTVREYIDTTLNVTTGKKYPRHIEYEIPYTDGKANGTEKEYYEDGHLLRETPFINGKEDGIVRTYYEDGRLMREDHYVKGVPQPGGTKSYKENGKEIK